MGISEKLAYLKETKEQIKSALQTPHNVFRDYATLIEKYVKNQPKSIVEGSTVICENGIDLPCDVDINGMSKQNTTEGLALVDFANPEGKTNITSYTYNNDIVTIGSDKSYGFAKWNLLDLIKANAGRRLYCYIESVDFSNGLSPILQLKLTNNDVNSYNGLILVTGVSQGFTIPEDVSGITVAELQLSPNNTATNQETSISITKPIITFTENAPYEPYTNGASPNTEYEQDIEVIENGYNKYNIGDIEETTQNGVTYSIKKGRFKANGTATVAITIATTNKRFNLDSGIYTLGSKVISGSYSGIVGKYVSKNDGSNLIDGNLIDVVSIKTLTENNTNLYASIFIGNGATFDNYEVDLILIEGIYTKDTLPAFLPYGHIGLVQRGIQLLNPLKVKTIGVTQTLNGVNFIPQKDGGIKIQGTSTAVTDYYLTARVFGSTTTDIKLDKTKKHTYELFGSNSSMVRLFLGYGESAMNTYIPKTFTPSWDIAWAFIRIEPNTTVDMTVYPSLCEGENTPYEPYIEPIVRLIDLAGNSLAKVGEIADLLNIGVDGRVKIGDKVIKRYVFTGNEYMITSSRTDVKRYAITNVFGEDKSIKDNARNDVLCNYFKTITADLSNAGYLGLSKYNETGVMINLPLDTEFSTLELFKAWLKEKYDSGEPLYIDYVLANPKTIDLPSIEPIKLIEGITNVFELVTNLGTTMKVEYIVNAETLQNEITELSNAVIELGGTL